MSHEDKPSEPYSCLSFRSDAQAGKKMELHLGNRGYTRLADFHAFISLDQLWINNNKLTTLQGLEANFRLKILYAHANRVRHLNGALSTFKFMTKLNLADNKLDDLEGTLEELTELRYLQSLDLYGNPISQEDNYRLLVIMSIPWLETLDRLQVTDDERAEAKELEKKLNSLKSFKFKGPKNKPTEEQIAAHDLLESTCTRALSGMGEHVTNKRIFLETYFTPYDKKNLGLVDVPTFQLKLKELDLARCLDDGEEEALIEKYSTRVPSYLSEEFSKMQPKKMAVDYRRLCQDLLPPGLRVLKDTNWVAEMPREMSLGTVDLEKFTAEVEKRRIADDEARLKASMNAGIKDTGPVFSSKRRPYTCEEHGLDAWFASALLKKLKAVHTKAGDTLGKAEVKLVLSHMEVLGCVPEMGVFNARQMLLGPDSKVTIAALCDALGCEGIVGVDVSNIADCDKRSCVKWRLVNNQESEKLAEKEFDSAAMALDTLLRAGASDDTKDIGTKTMSHSQSGTRLLSRRVRTKKPKAFVTPADVMRGMGRREDMIVLPNLKGAEAKEAKEKAITDKFDFSATFESLGLSGEALEVALLRKKRSLLEVEEKERSARIISGLPGPTRKAGGAVEERVSELRKFLQAPMYDKGWNAGTGTVVFHAKAK
jgi:hypothetical protein